MKLEALDGLEWTDPRLGQKLLPSLAKKKPGDWAGHESLFAVTRKGPAQGGKAGSPKG